MRVIFCMISLFAMAVCAQELPNANISINGEIPPGFYKAEVRYGKEKNDYLQIKWSRNAEVDTFWVYKANSSLKYITNSKTRTVWYNQPIEYERRMAAHHLREHLLESPLKFDNLESLAKNRIHQFLGKNLHDYFSK